MKKKFLFLSALVAATTAFIGCSSDENLAEVPEVIEEPAPEPEPQGTPLRVVVGNGTTRADLTKTTTANLKNFTLYGMQPSNYWLTGATFTGGNDNWTSASNPTWPTQNKGVATSFYGFSDGVTDGVPTGVDPTITPSEQKFTFTLGAGVESAPGFCTQTMTDIAKYPAQAQTGLLNQRTTAQTKTKANVLSHDSERLIDLLVTHDGTGTTTALEAKEIDNEGILKLKFKHALANLVIRAYFVGDEAGTTWPSTANFYIEWIRIHNLCTSGTYTFGTGWTVNTDDKVLYEKVYGEEDGGVANSGDDKRWTMAVQAYSDAQTNGITYKDLVSAGEFMVIPQTYTNYAGVGTTISTAEAAGDCYIEVHGYFVLGGGSNTKQGRGVPSYFPLTLKGGTTTIQDGYQYVIDLNLTEMLDKEGVNLRTPSIIVAG